jgi:hypothetical protein
MTTRWVRWGTRVLAAVSVMALVSAFPDITHAEDTQVTTTYDGEATAFQTTGLTLRLFPADEKLPEPFADIPAPPEQVIELSSDQLGLPRRLGHAEYRGVDEAGALPANPVLSGSAFRASSIKVDGKVVSEASIGEIDINSGALTLENVVARCTGDGEQIQLDAPLGAASGNVDGEVELEPGTAVALPGLGSVTWNDQTTDGSTHGEVATLVLDLETDLDADALQDLPDAMKAFEDVVQQVLSDLQQAGEDIGLPKSVDPEDATLQQLYRALDTVVSQIPTDQLPDLNWLLNLSGSITLASATCSQETDVTPIGNPPPDNNGNPPPGNDHPGTGGSEPPLADTGVSPWPVRAGLVGLLAIGTGGLLILRRRHDS